ncbi:CCRG-2 family RiPP [Prochlorococcus marinus]|uniref:CCRG-2 family RiPP n=1 Tax=Prochlorococcus marinus TaxID=1219 RepID=UPI0007B39EDC|nr:CCRG-2 family RiPP [Prochlorococcus marinus]
MADPKENEEINEELSVDELKSVSGGLLVQKTVNIVSSTAGSRAYDPASSGSGLIEAGDADYRNTKAAGSGMTVQDWNRANKSGLAAEIVDR